MRAVVVWFIVRAGSTVTQIYNCSRVPVQTRYRGLHLCDCGEVARNSTSDKAPVAGAIGLPLLGLKGQVSHVRKRPNTEGYLKIMQGDVGGTAGNLTVQPVGPITSSLRILEHPAYQKRSLQPYIGQETAGITRSCHPVSEMPFQRGWPGTLLQRQADSDRYLGKQRNGVATRLNGIIRRHDIECARKKHSPCL